MIRLASAASLWMLVALPAAATGQPAPAATGTASRAVLAVEGLYRLSGGPDTASELLLTPDGRFQFFLVEGAADFRAEGRWSRDGDIIRLNTEPTPVPPTFLAGPVGRDEENPVRIVVRGPGGQGLALIDVRLGTTDGRVIEGYTQDDGWSPPNPANWGGEVEDDRDIVSAWVELSLVWQGIAPARFELDPGAGNRFEFTLVPNDLGVVDFRDREIVVTEDGLSPFEAPEVLYVRDQE